MAQRSKTDKADTFKFFWRVHAPIDAPEPMEEYNFDKHLGRRHRFDFAWLYKKVAVEVNGNAWSVQGGGRHGKDDDLEKLNIANVEGWCVLQFSPAMLQNDPAACVDMVLKALGLQQERMTA